MFRSLTKSPLAKDVLFGFLGHEILHNACFSRSLIVCCLRVGEVRFLGLLLVSEDGISLGY